MRYRVTVYPSRLSFIVHDTETILDAAIRLGYFFPHHCRLGVCGTCRGNIVKGEVDYAGRETLALTEDEKEQGHALFCCATAKSNLIIYVNDFAYLEKMTPRTLLYDVIECHSISKNVSRILLKA